MLLPRHNSYIGENSIIMRVFGAGNIVCINTNYIYTIVKHVIMTIHTYTVVNNIFTPGNGQESRASIHKSAGTQTGLKADKRVTTFFDQFRALPSMTTGALRARANLAMAGTSAACNCGLDGCLVFGEQTFVPGEDTTR